MAREDRRLGFLATGGLKELDLSRCVQSLREAGFSVEVLRAASPGETAQPPSGRCVDEVSPDDFSALVLPASPPHAQGTYSDDAVVRLVQAMQAVGKPVLYFSVPAAGTSAREARPAARFNLKCLLTDSWKHWNAIDAPRLGAALAYYTLLSLAPLVVLIVSITGLFFKRAIIQSGLVWQVQQLMGNAGASVVVSILEHAKLSTGIIGVTLGSLTLMMGGSAVFLELRDSLDTVWGVKPPYGTGVFSLLRARAFAFLTILATGLALTFLFLLSALLATPARFILRILPTQGVLTEVLTSVFSLVAMTLIFALIYKAIPDIHIRWSDVWIGAALTATLFTAGKSLIGLYLSTAGIGSPYAAAGSLIVFLTWVYYSAQIFLFGAEFTHVYALRYGSYSKLAKRPKTSWAGWAAVTKSGSGS